MNRMLIIICILLLFAGCTKNPASSTPDEYILASNNKNEIDNLAISLQTDAKLMNIKSDDVYLNGGSKSWIYIYYSPAADSRYFIQSTYEDINLDSMANSALDGISIIADDWFDSDEALEIAEKNGGKTFRKDNPEYYIEASLSQPLIPDASTNWYIEYHSLADDSHNLLLGIDASTSEIVLKYPE